MLIVALLATFRLQAADRSGSVAAGGPSTSPGAWIEETPRDFLPLPKLELPPTMPARPATNLARRPLVLTFTPSSVELRGRFARERFNQTRALAPFAPLLLNVDRRSETVELIARHCIVRDLELSIGVPQLDLRETQPSRLPATAVTDADIQEQFFRKSGLGDVTLGLSKQVGLRLDPLRSAALDLSVKLATGDSGFPAGTALLAPGSGQIDVVVGIRVQREVGAWTATALAHRAFRDTGTRTASDGTSITFDSGDEWRYGVRADRAWRRWLVGSLGLSGFSASNVCVGGVEQPGTSTDRLLLEPGITLSITDDVEATVSGELPLLQTRAPSQGSYTFGLRGFF